MRRFSTIQHEAAQAYESYDELEDTFQTRRQDTYAVSKGRFRSGRRARYTIFYGRGDKTAKPMELEPIRFNRDVIAAEHSRYMDAIQALGEVAVESGDPLTVMILNANYSAASALTSERYLPGV